MVHINVSDGKALENFFEKQLHFHQTKILRKLQEHLEFELKVIADGALNAMRSYITTQAKSPKGKLEEALTVDFKVNKNTISFSIGDKDKLNHEAPYWYVLNYGVTRSGVKFVPPANWGHFEGGEWKHTGKDSKEEGDINLQPQGFTPIGYISVGVKFIKDRLQELERNLSKVYKK